MYSQVNGRHGSAVAVQRSNRVNASSGYGRRNDGFQSSYSYNGANSHSNPVTPTLATGPSEIDMFGVNSFNTAVTAAMGTDQMAANSFSHMNNYGNNSIRPHTASSTTTRPLKTSHLTRGYDSAVDLSGMAHLSMLGQPTMPVLGLSETSPINSPFPLQQMPLAPQTQPMGSTVHSPLDAYLPTDTTSVTPQLQSMSPTGSPLLDIYLQQNKTTVRPEVEMKMKLSLNLSPTSPFRYIRFPRELLARPSQLATTAEVINNSPTALSLSLHLVSDSFVRTPQGKSHALRLAQSPSSLPTRSPDTPVTELPKTSPAHPQNGGKMIICKQCQMRERKRYGRKKQVDSERWNYESQRIILVNENEFKRLSQVPSPSSQFVRSVDFKMRILCYNRHQDCLEPDGRAYSGYRVVFTFTDCEGTVVGQHLSDAYHIADDHKDAGVKFGQSGAVVLQPQTQTMSAAAYAQPQMGYSNGQASMSASGFVQTTGPTYAGYDPAAAAYWGQ